MLGKKKSEDFQGFFSKTLLIFGGRRCRSPYSIFIRHSDIELEQTSVSCCFRIFEAKNQANLYQYISKSSCPKVCRSVLKNQFCILYITSLSSHPNNIGNSIGSRHIYRNHDMKYKCITNLSGISKTHCALTNYTLLMLEFDFFLKRILEVAQKYGKAIMDSNAFLNS